MEATRKEKAIIYVGALILAFGAGYLAKHNIGVADIDNKGNEIVNDYIVTQEELEKEGYSFTFNFHNKDNGLKMEKTLKGNLKDERYDFIKVLKEKCDKANFLSCEMLQTLKFSKVLEGKTFLRKEKDVLEHDSEELIKTYNFMISLEFPEDMEDDKELLYRYGKILQSELEIMLNNINNVDSDEILAVNKILKEFAIAVNDISEEYN